MLILQNVFLFNSLKNTLRQVLSNNPLDFVSWIIRQHSLRGIIVKYGQCHNLLNNSKTDTRSDTIGRGLVSHPDYSRAKLPHAQVGNGELGQANANFAKRKNEKN